MGRNALYALNGGMYDSSLIRIHRFELNVPAELENLICAALSKSLKIFISLLSVIAYVNGNSLIAIRFLVCKKSYKILNGIECFAVTTDKNAVIIVGFNLVNSFLTAVL